MSRRDLATRPSAIAGLGLFARRPFGAGETIARYTGRSSGTPPAPAPGTTAVYALELRPGLWLDGSAADNPARHANHSCDPNAELVWPGLGAGARLVARRPIPPDEEITFDYGFSLADSLGHPCACGQADCAGRIVAAPLRPALRRHVRFSRPRD